MRSMQKMWEDYAKEVQVLRERIAELREVLQRDKTMAPLERQELEARKRLLSEEGGIWNGAWRTLRSMPKMKRQANRHVHDKSRLGTDAVFRRFSSGPAGKTTCRLSGCQKHSGT